MSTSNDRRPTWPGGIAALLTQMEGRRDPIDYAPGEAPPPADLDLAPLAAQIVADPDDDPAEAPPFRSSHHRKRHALRREMTGQSELVFLNALLIAHLRKRTFPDHLPALFLRLWREQGCHLLMRLDPRWLVSSVTTFGDHGATPTQRSVGLALTVLFGTMKLYESERLFSGLPPDRPFPADRRSNTPLPMEMDAYSIASGGLDVNMIGRLWTEAEADPLIRPLAHHLLDLLIHDDRTLFRRLMTMRARKARKAEGGRTGDEGNAAQMAHDAESGPRTDNAEKMQGSGGAETARPAAETGTGTARMNDGAGAPPEPRDRTKAKPDNPAPVPVDRRQIPADRLRWGLVATIRAPLPEIARFAAHHLALGAEALHIYLDAPEPGTQTFLRRHPKLHVTACDDAYWQATGKPRPEAHQLRQAMNATRCLRETTETLDWLAHVDVDEFLLPQRPVAAILAEVSPRHAAARIPPAEALAPETGWPSHFKLTHHHARQPKAVLQDIYPTFGAHLYGGFLSHTSGKIFARTGIPDTRLGIHTLKYNGLEATNRARLDTLRLAHLHAPSWQHFRDHLAFRQEKGSYRPRSERIEMGQANLIAFLLEEEGDAGLRLLFDEVCADTPGLRARLAAHDMLLTTDFDPDAEVRRLFGALP